MREGKDRDLKNKESCTIDKDLVQDHLRNLKVHKFIGLDEKHLQVQGELVNEVA